MTIPGKLLHPTGLPLYVRPGGLPGSSDIKTYDCGNLWISTSGVSDNSTKLGELHVTYAVEFSIPILESTNTAPMNNSVSQFYTTGTSYTTNTATTCLFGGTGGVFVNGLNIVNSSGSLTPVPGNYLVDTTMWCSDNATELFTGACELQKNGVSPTGITIPQVKTTLASGADVSMLNSTYFVQANGTDVFTTVITLTGAGGTLTGSTMQRWVAI
jgi:hypothetical protein